MRISGLLILALAWMGCSSSGDNGPSNANGGSSNGAGAGGENSAGSSSAGSSGSEVSNHAGSAGNESAAAGASGGSGVVDASTEASSVVAEAGSDAGSGTLDASKGPFTCNLIIGLLVTQEWFNAGFETVAPNANWELKAAHYAYTQEWANPNSTFWATPITSACTKNADMPDRVIYVALNWDYTTAAQWESDVTKDVNVIKMKYPSVKNIELLTVVRCPLSCGTPPPRPGETCYVEPYSDQALAAVAAKMPDLVTVGPKFQDDTCTDFLNLGTHMTTAATAATGIKIGTYYATH